MRLFPEFPFHYSTFHSTCFIAVVTLFLGIATTPLYALDPPSVPSLGASARPQQSPQQKPQQAAPVTTAPVEEPIAEPAPEAFGAGNVPGDSGVSSGTVPDVTRAEGDWQRELSELFPSGSGGRVGGTVKIAILLSVLSLVPAILMMTTSFVRIITVLSILRQGLGTGQTPPTQVLTAIAVFMTLLVMTPTFTKIWDGAIRPFSDKEITFTEALKRGEAPMRTFLWKQIERAGNTETIYQLLEYVPNAQPPRYYEDIPWRVLLPAFMRSI